MRYQPPLASKDASGQFAELSRVLDAREQPPAFAPSSAAIVQVGAGETKRLAPRAAGQTVILPAADETNYGALVTLLVDSTLGTCKVKPISGTLNGAASFTLAAGYQSLLVLMSDGAGRWLTERAEGYPLTNGDKGDITVTGTGATWTIDAGVVTNAKLADMAARRIKGREDGVAAGVPQDLVGAEVGEILRISSTLTDSTSTGTVVTFALTENLGIVRFVSGITALTLRGATIPAETGQIVIWENNDDTGVNVTFNNEDGSAAAAGNRFRCPLGAALVIAPGTRVLSVYINQRWRFIR